MDRLDIDILREMSRDSMLLWSSTAPFVSSDAIAARLGVAGSTVRARLRAWAREGFLRGLEVLPNPCLLGAAVARAFVRVDDLRAKPRVLADLGLVGGVIGALDHVGPWVGVAVVRERDPELARALALLRRLPGVDEVTAPDAVPIGPCDLAPAPADWRLLQVLRASPQAPFSELAARTGMSTRTFTRHFQGLATRRALWAFPVLDFTAFQGGVVGRLTVATAGGAGRRVAERLRQAFPAMLELHEHRAAREHPASVDVLLWQPSVGAMEDAQRSILGLPQVQGVELVYPRRLHVFPQWFDERIAERAGAPRAGPVRAGAGR